MGRQLFARHVRKHGTVYESREACRTYPNRCTDSPNPKSVKFGPETHYVPVRMYGTTGHPLQQIADIEQPNRYHAFDRVARQSARVMLFVKRDIQK